MRRRTPAAEESVLFLVPYAEKDHAKELGARWDPIRKKWYAPDASVASQLDAHWRRVQPLPAPVAATRRRHSGESSAAHPATTGLTYFAVPYEKKDVAKGMGARWQPDVKMWASSDPSVCSQLAQHFDSRDLSRPVHLPGEDRGFAGDRLFIDMIPQTAWYSNARAMIAPEDWDRVRLHVYSRVHYCCECCGVDTRDPANGTRMECHERWDWQGDGRGVGRQVLKRLVGLCRECHGATHYGLAGLQGRAAAAMQHLVRVNGSSLAQEEQRRQDAVEVWHERSAQRWQPDLSILTNGGIGIQDRRAARVGGHHGGAWDEYGGLSEGCGIQ